MRPSSTLSQRLTYARKLRKMSRRSLSLAAGLSSSMVSQIERGEIGDPRGTTVQALADALSVDAGWLLAGLGEQPGPADEGQEPSRSGPGAADPNSRVA